MFVSLTSFLQLEILTLLTHTVQQFKPQFRDGHSFR